MGSVMTMCSGTTCPLSDSCKRYKLRNSKMAINSHWKSYFSFPPYNTETKDCSFYINKKTLNKKTVI